MSTYLDKIKDCDILSNEKIVELFIQYHATNNQQARTKIINSTLKLVAKIAHQYKRYGKFEDMLQEGNVGLLKAIDKFDFTLEVPWSHYAAQWIRAYILKFVHNNNAMVKRGGSTQERKYYWKLLKEKSKLEAQGKPSDAEALASIFHLKKDDVEFILSRSSAFDVPLQSLSPSFDEESSTEEVPDQDTYNVESDLINHLSNKDIEEKMNFFVEKLNPQRKLIFINRFMSEEYQTLAELGEKLGVSRQRIQQIESELKKQFLSHIKI